MPVMPYFLKITDEGRTSWVNLFAVQKIEPFRFSIRAKSDDTFSGYRLTMVTGEEVSTCDELQVQLIAEFIRQPLQRVPKSEPKKR